MNRGIAASPDPGSRSIGATSTSDEAAGAVRTLGCIFVACAAACFVAFFGLALLFAITIPVPTDWDAFAYGEWSRRIATDGSLDSSQSRPVRRGAPSVSWASGSRLVGHGRLIRCGPAAVARLCRGGGDEQRCSWSSRGKKRALTLIAFVSIAVFAEEAIAGLTDVPAAAAVACVCAASLAQGFRGQRVLVLMLALLAVLAKPSSVLPALFGLAVALLIVERPRSRPEVFGSVLFALGVGASFGLLYDWGMAVHLKMGLLAFLRAGTTGYYAQLADSLRTDTILRLDFLGPDLRLPLAFVLVYGLARLVGVRHPLAATLALAIGGGYALIGPFIAGDPNGPFTSAYAGFAFVSFALLFGVLPLAPADLHPESNTNDSAVLDRAATNHCLGRVGGLRVPTRGPRLAGTRRLDRHLHRLLDSRPSPLRWCCSARADRGSGRRCVGKHGEHRRVPRSAVDRVSSARHYGNLEPSRNDEHCSPRRLPKPSPNFSHR